MTLSPLSLARNIKPGKNAILYFHFCSSWECKKMKKKYQISFPQSSWNIPEMEETILLWNYTVHILYYIFIKHY